MHSFQWISLSWSITSLVPVCCIHLLCGWVLSCNILTFDPAQKCYSKVMHWKEVTHSNGSYERKSHGRKFANEMGRAKKFPWYTHRLMHRKRVTSELHDNYFRLMTIKHSISKIEWVSNDYIAQLSSTSELPAKIGWSWRRDVVRKTTPGRKGPWEALMNWGPEKMLIRCSKESQHPAEWTPGPPVEHQENEKDTTLTTISLGVKILQLCSISNSLSHANPE